METLQRTANRGSISTGYDIENSLKFFRDNSEILKMNFSTGGSNQTFTWSFWCKRAGSQRTGLFAGIIMGNGVSGNDAIYCQFPSSPLDSLQIKSVSSASTQFDLVTSRKFRDCSAWYHIVIAVDTTQATAANRVKLYVNGVQETAFSTETYPSQNANTYMGNGGGQVQVGSINSSSPTLSAYLADVYCIEGQQLLPTDFGEFDSNTGIWKPIEYQGTFGSNYAFYLKFDNASSLGADSSGLGNNFSLTNITSADQATDTPTNTFCTFNPLILYRNGVVFAEAITKEGDTLWQTDRAAWWRIGFGSMAVTAGKWYAEFVPDTNTAFVGVGSYDEYEDSTHLGASGSNGVGYYGQNGNIYDSSTNYSWGSTFTSGDIISIALDRDNGYVYFAKNGTWQNSGDPTSGSSGTGGVSLVDPNGTHYMGISLYNVPTNFKANWGGYTANSIASGNADANDYGNFEYAPPTGYYAMCTKNLAEFG